MTSQAFFTRKNTWSRTYVPGADMPTMIPNHNGMTYTTQSKFHCASKAMENSRFLMCIYNSECIISSYESDAMDSDAGITDPVTCMTIWPVCKLWNFYIYVIFKYIFTPATF